MMRFGLRRRAGFSPCTNGRWWWWSALFTSTVIERILDPVIKTPIFPLNDLGNRYGWLTHVNVGPRSLPGLLEFIPRDHGIEGWADVVAENLDRGERESESGRLKSNSEIAGSHMFSDKWVSVETDYEICCFWVCGYWIQTRRLCHKTTTIISDKF